MLLAQDPRPMVGCFLLVFNQERTRGKGNKESFNEVLLPWYCWSKSRPGQLWAKVIFFFLFRVWEINMLLMVQFSWDMRPPKKSISSQDFVEMFWVKTLEIHCTKGELVVDLRDSLCKLLHMERENLFWCWFFRTCLEDCENKSVIDCCLIVMSKF